MKAMMTRRDILAAGGGLAVAALDGSAHAQTAAPSEFNWRKHAGVTLRCATIRFPLSEIQQRRLGTSKS